MKDTVETGGLLVSRNDGLGARLMPIINGLRLGKLLDIPVYIHWPTFQKGHNTSQYETLFSESFRSEFLITSAAYQALNTQKLRSEHELTKMNAQEIQNAVAKGDLFFLENTEVNLGIKDEDEDSIRKGFSTALPGVYFTDTVQSHMAAIRAQMESDAPLIYHIRHGDLTWSHQTRSNPWPNKYIPNEIYLAHMAYAGISEENPAYLIGDSVPCLDWIASRQKGAEWLDHLLEKDALTSLQYDFLELFAMSQARKIIAPEHSGFSKTAARLKNVPVEDVKNSLPKDILESALVALKNRISDDRKSFINDGDVAQSIVHLIQSGNGEIVSDTHGLIQKEITTNNTVPFLYLYASENLLKEGSFDQMQLNTERAQNAMMAPPKSLSAINALTAEKAIQENNFASARPYLARSVYLFSFAPQVARPLYEYLKATQETTPDNFYPHDIPKYFNEPSPSRLRILNLLFAWDCYAALNPQQQKQLLMMSQKSNISAHIIKMLSELDSKNEAEGHHSLKNLNSLIEFCSGQESSLLQLENSNGVKQSPFGIQRLVTALIKNNIYDEALNNMQELISNHPNQLYYNGLIGELYFRSGDYEKSLHHLSKANSDEIIFPRFVTFQIKILDRFKRQEEATKIFHQFLSETGWGDNFVAQYCLRSLSEDEIKTLITKLEKLIPGSETFKYVHAELAQLYLALHDHDTAAEHYKKAVSLDRIPPSYKNAAISTAFSA